MKTKNRIIVLFLICILFLNFLFEYKVHAEAIAISAGFALFLKACYAAGITYIGGQAVTRVTKESMELYKEWEKFIDKQPPEKKPPSGWEKSVLGGLLGAQAWDSVKRLIDSVKDFFDELGSKQGDNNYILPPPPGHGYYDGYNYTYRFSYNHADVPRDRIYLSLNQNEEVLLYDVTRFTGPVKFVSFKITSIELLSSGRINVSFEGTHRLVDDTTGSSDWNFKSSKVIDKVPKQDNNYPQVPINYYYEHNSYQFTNNPNDIRPVYPNFDNLPDGKLVQITDPHGKLLLTIKVLLMICLMIGLSHKTPINYLEVSQ